jgi:cytochrome c biogenesis protein ResB
MTVIVKECIAIFVSLRTSLWILTLLIILALAGAVVMPAHEEFQSINSAPLFQWLPEQSLSGTWWLWAAIGLLVLLSANTLFCSIESIIRKRNAEQWLFVISPQVIHVGFLFILVAHLMTGISGFKAMAEAREGTELSLTDDTLVQIKNITISSDSVGNMTDWSVGIEYLSHGEAVKRDMIMPNKPSFFSRGIGIYVRDLKTFPDEAVLLEVSKEPGALWALIGGALFAAGTGMLVVLKMKREG